MALLITVPAKKPKENACKYFWTVAPNRTDDDFYLVIGLDDGARIWKNEAGRPWHMRLKINGKTFVGERETLEDAFKATDRLIYKNASHVWTQSDAHAVLVFFEGDLSL